MNASTISGRLFVCSALFYSSGANADRATTLFISTGWSAQVVSTAGFSLACLALVFLVAVKGVR